MKWIVGLGNPGKTYACTPHNVGFEVVDLLVSSFGAEWRRRAGFNALVAEIDVTGGRCRLLKPQTYMNLSGLSVAAALRYYRDEPADIAVISDDADLPLGRLRIRGGGSSGGHQGVESLIKCLGTESFARVRVGVGRTQLPGGLREHVLGKFSDQDRRLVDQVVAVAASAARCVLSDGVDMAMNRYNGWTPREGVAGKDEQEG